MWAGNLRSWVANLRGIQFCIQVNQANSCEIRLKTKHHIDQFPNLSIPFNSFRFFRVICNCRLFASRLQKFCDQLVTAEVWSRFPWVEYTRPSFPLDQKVINVLSRNTITQRCTAHTMFQSFFSATMACFNKNATNVTLVTLWFYPVPIIHTCGNIFNNIC